ncbi:MAG TPA: inosine/xanthosine triphosphatase [Calditrichia bacterium]|nr:inosine/xanthosine triphosphatase [Calditrichota bacterium]HQU74442.1 inosine/xanthosine triphosphatase [Calditrichia bacterium]HQV33975.1 inosine/xanthosine triphosphatase [Calditrichia bacterium]
MNATTSVQKIAVASLNPVKIRAAQQGISEIFPERRFQAGGLAVPSGVSDQPMNDAETYQGAYNRLVRLREAVSDARFWVAIEGGVEELDHGLSAFAWILISDGKRLGRSRTGSFFLPSEVSEMVRSGVELGHANDAVFSKHNSKQSGGAIGILTHGVLDRTGLYRHAVLLAMVPFINEDLFHPVL